MVLGREGARGPRSFGFFFFTSGGKERSSKLALVVTQGGITRARVASGHGDRGRLEYCFCMWKSREVK